MVAIAGDISCGPGNTPSVATCRQFDTSELIVAMNPSLVIAAGDIQYDDGRYEDYLRNYDVTWGRFKPITRPALGNHEYQLYSDARGYFDYFNGVGVSDGPAGTRGRGFYSFNIGAWHVVVINSNCERVGGCGVDSTQWRWLRDDLQASTATCTLAVQHYPRFSSGSNGSTGSMLPFWQLLSLRGFMVGSNGLNYRTADGWATIDSVLVGSFTAQVCFAVLVPTPSTVLVGGSMGNFFRSTDRGGTWTTTESGTRYYALDFADSLNGVAVGWRGTVVKTTDGGQSWTEIRGINGFEAYDVQMFSPSSFVVEAPPAGSTRPPMEAPRS